MQFKRERTAYAYTVSKRLNMFHAKLILLPAFEDNFIILNASNMDFDARKYSPC